MGYFIVFAVIAIVLFGLVYWYYKKNRKPESESKEEPAPMAQLHMKIANMEAQGKVVGNDFEIFIISESEYNSKTKEEIDNWLRSRFEDKAGKFSSFTAEKGLAEFTYTTTDKTYDIFLLLVDKTAEDVIKPQDKTSEVRGLLSSDKNIEFEKEEVVVNGMLPEDYNHKYGDAGARGILRLENQSNKTIEGNGVHFKQTKPPIPEGYVFDRDHKTGSRLSFLKGLYNTNVKIKNVVFTGLNTEEGSKNGFPVFHPDTAFEHGYDLEGNENLVIDGCGINGVGGDGLYLRRGTRDNKNIKIVNCKINGTGRQGIGIVDGTNILIENLEAEGIRRCLFDIEPNSKNELVKGVVFRKSTGQCNLPAFPMNGKGSVENVLIEDIEYDTYSRTTECSANKKTTRKNIIFRRIRCEKAYSSHAACYTFNNAENVLIDSNYRPMHEGPSYRRKIIHLNNCKNVVIRHNDFPNARHIVLENTDPSEVKVYGNKQKLQFLILKEGESIEGKRDVSGAFDIEEYDVEKYGEPDIPTGEDFFKDWEGA